MYLQYCTRDERNLEQWHTLPFTPEKARELIAQGAVLNFGYLISVPHQCEKDLTHFVRVGTWYKDEGLILRDHRYTFENGAVLIKSNPTDCIDIHGYRYSVNWKKMCIHEHHYADGHREIAQWRNDKLPGIVDLWC